MMILLNPGRANFSQDVYQALLGPDLRRREPDFIVLKRPFAPDCCKYTAFLRRIGPQSCSPGSGIAAVEAMITSLIPCGGGKLFVVENGVYGEAEAREMDDRHESRHLSLPNSLLL